MRTLFLVMPALCAGAVAQSAVETTLDRAAPELPVLRPVLLPRAIASFGADRAGRWLYVQGGHVGRTHAHSRDNVVASFHRLDLHDGSSWEELPAGAAVQGTALVAHGNVLYRVGGMTAHNAPGETDALESLASVQRFDPEQRQWSEMSPLPEPRSSHDACVVDDRIYVVGGWALAGEGGGQWHATAWTADLTASPLRWEPLAQPPFQRRAAAVVRLGKRVAVIGGMEEDEGQTQAVSLYDPESSSWSAGPEFPGEGFGVAATAVGDEVYASGRDGTVFRFDASGARWERRATLAFPRFFHRLATTPDGALVAVGGAGPGGHLRTLEMVASDAAVPVLHEWGVTVPSAARSRHALLLRRDQLYVFGGNRSLRQHDFEPDDFVRDSFRIDLALMQASPVAPLPSPRQSMQTAQWGSREVENVVLGGFAHDGEVARSHANGWEFDFANEAWSELAARLPEPRTQFAVAEHDGRVWVLGGTDYDPRRGSTSDDFRYPLEVLVRETSDESVFAASGVTLPGPRRAFGTAVLGERLYLIGGMRGDFEVVEECDVFEFGTRTWSTVPSPARARISPEVAVLGGRIWVAGGSSRNADGDIEPNTSLDVFDPEHGWRTVAELPFATRHVQMRAVRDHLLFFSTYFEDGGRAAVWMLRPPEIERGAWAEAAQRR